MDLLDFDQAELYFDEPLESESVRLIDAAICAYDTVEAETMLLRANMLSPQHLIVQVALYRYYYFQRRLDDALLVAESALAIAGKRLMFPETGKYLQGNSVHSSVKRSMGLVRFYLMALKAAALANLELGNQHAGNMMLDQLIELEGMVCADEQKQNGRMEFNLYKSTVVFRKGIHNGRTHNRRSDGRSGFC